MFFPPYLTLSLSLSYLINIIYIYICIYVSTLFMYTEYTGGFDHLLFSSLFGMILKLIRGCVAAQDRYETNNGYIYIIIYIHRIIYIHIYICIYIYICICICIIYMM